MPRLLYTVDNLVSEVRQQVDELNRDSVSTEDDILPTLGIDCRVDKSWQDTRCFLCTIIPLGVACRGRLHRHGMGREHNIYNQGVLLRESIEPAARRTDGQTDGLELRLLCRIGVGNSCIGS